MSVLLTSSSRPGQFTFFISAMTSWMYLRSHVIACWNLEASCVAAHLVKKNVSLYLHGRQDLNPQPAVLETAALPN